MPSYSVHAQCLPVLVSPGYEQSPVYLNPANYNLLQNGQASNLTGGSGQVMLRIPKFHYKIAHIASGVKGSLSYEVSLFPFSGSSVHPAFIKNGVEVDCRYVGVYPASWYDTSAGAYVTGDGLLSGFDIAVDKIGSVTGKKPASNLTRAKFRSAASRVGTGWQIMDFHLYSAVKLLYLTRYADLDSQSILGQGNTRFSSWDYATCIGNTGKVTSTSAIGQSTAGGNSGDYVNLFGIEDIFGGIWEWIDGWNINSGVNYVCQSSANFADDTSTNYTLFGATNPTTAEFQETLQSNSGLIPGTVGGTGNSSVDLCDYYYYAGGWVAPAAGGNANDGLNAGLFVLTATNASSNADAVIGARLCY